MAGEQNNPLDFADDKIQEIEKKIQEKNKNLGPQKREEIFARINGTVPPAPTESSEKIEGASAPAIKNLRTFQGDVADAIKRQNASVLTIALAEKRKQQTQTEARPLETSPSATPPIKPVVKPPQPKSPQNPELKRNILMATLSIILITLGIGVVFGFYTLTKKENSPVAQDSQGTILGWSKKNTLQTSGLDREEFIDAIYKKRQTEEVGLGEILYVELTQTAEERITPLRFFALVKSKAPASLIRSFNTQLMFGFFNVEGSNQPFLLVRLESFDRAFDGMLSWEKTMFDDVGPLFTRNILPIKEESSQGGTSTETKILSIGAPPLAQFDDEAIKNKDARILKNTQGETLLLYSFLDKETLLITSNEQVLEELVNKLVAQKLIR